MLFFRRLLNYRIGSRLRDHRNAPRHSVGADFPLKCNVHLIGRDTIGAVRQAAPGAGCHWSGRLINLSLDGLSLRLPPAAIAVRGEETTLVLTVEGRELEIPCTVAHFRSLRTHALCGLSLQLTNAHSKAAYHQLIEAVGIGANFTVVSRPRGLRTPKGFVGEQYQSGPQYILTAWRDTVRHELAGFELLLGDFCVKGLPGAKDLEIYSLQPQNRTGKNADSAPGLSLSTGRHAEVRQLFRWVVLNLSQAIPADLRAQLGRFIVPADRTT